MAENRHVKILFRFYSDLLEEETVETMFATIVNEVEGLYKIDNIPFYVEGTASDDIVFAEFDKDEERLTYRETIEYSGNSIIQVAILDDETEIETIRDMFRTLGCTSEKLNDSFFSIEIPAHVGYKIVKSKLDEMEEQEIIAYAEPCLSENHMY